MAVDLVTAVSMLEWDSMRRGLRALVLLGTTACSAGDHAEALPGDAQAYVGDWVFTAGLIQDVACSGDIEPRFTHPLKPQALLISSQTAARVDVTVLNCTVSGLNVALEQATLESPQPCALSGKKLEASGKVVELSLRRDGERLLVAGKFDSQLREEGMVAACPNLVLNGAVAERAGEAP